jgi:autotransporter adhesin
LDEAVSDRKGNFSVLLMGRCVVIPTSRGDFKPTKWMAGVLEIACAVAICFALSPTPAVAQFVCAGSATGAAPLTGGGATAGALQSVACGTSANANSPGGGANSAFGNVANASGALAINTALGWDSSAFGDSSGNVAVGTANSSGTGSYNTALGYNANGSGNTSNNTATGRGAYAYGDNSSNTAVGTFSSAFGDNSANTAFGYSAYARAGSGNSNLAAGANASAGGTTTNFLTNAGATALGVGAQAGATAVGQTNATAVGNGALANAANASAFGQGAVASAIGGTAMGQGAIANFANSTAIGAGSATSAANTVSVGSAGNERRITNVAAGINQTDAVNMGQLSGLSTGLQSQIYDNRSEARRGIAAAVATASAPMPSAPGKTTWQVRASTFQGEAGFGFGVAHRLNTSMPLDLIAGYGNGGGTQHTAYVGVGGEF